MNIIFDLDGTLLDSKPRLYHLFQHLVPSSQFTFDNYWDLKQNKVSHSDILKHYFNYSEVKIAAFNTTWMSLIEAEEWLRYDQLFEGVLPFLNALKKNHSIFIVTARQFVDSTLEQMENTGLIREITEVLVTQQIISKSNLIQSNIDITSSDWIIGDTGTDIQTGKELGLRTAAVLSGFLSKKQLLKYSPDIIVENLIDLNF